MKILRSFQVIRGSSFLIIISIFDITVIKLITWSALLNYLALELLSEVYFNICKQEHTSDVVIIYNEKFTVNNNMLQNMKNVLLKKKNKEINASLKN